MRTIFRSLLVLATCASAQAVPFTLTFTANEIPDAFTADFSLDFSFTTASNPGGFGQTVNYTIADQTFRVAGTSALETFTASPGGNSFQDVWTLDELPESVVSVRLTTSSPQSFSKTIYNNVFGEGNPLSFFGDYTVASQIQPGSITFNLDDPGAGAILFAAPVGGGAPEIGGSGLQVAFFALGVGVLARGRRKKFSPGLASS